MRQRDGKDRKGRLKGKISKGISKKAKRAFPPISGSPERSDIPIAPPLRRPIVFVRGDAQLDSGPIFLSPCINLRGVSKLPLLISLTIALFFPPLLWVLVITGLSFLKGGGALSPFSSDSPPSAPLCLPGLDRSTGSHPRGRRSRAIPLCEKTASRRHTRKWNNSKAQRQKQKEEENEKGD